MSQESKFMEALSALFVGARSEGQSGFANLMQIKNRYFEKIRPEFMKKIDSVAPVGSPFREELFDKLHAFFSRHFCESGSVYFRNIPSYWPAWEHVYADGGDMELVWKTRSLYYIKTDKIVESMPVEWDDAGIVRRFYFDASGVQHKQNNERRDFVFEYAGISSPSAGKAETVNIAVSISTQGRRTKTDEIIKAAARDGVAVEEKNLKCAFAAFSRQVEADFFIHKDARGFLHEQFGAWMYQYVFREGGDFSEERMKQLRGLREAALSLADFIGQFEDELVRVWRKPKFVRGANYVVTLDKLSQDVMKKVAGHAGIKGQVREWSDLGLVAKDFDFSNVVKISGAARSPKKESRAWKFLPIDTRYFKDIENDMLACLGDLDSALDGELVKSENWQALNTLREKYDGRVKCIYIDPPFNLGGSDQFDYRTNYKDSNWATMLENRLELARGFLDREGSMFVRCDYNGNWIVRCLMDKEFGDKNFKNEIAVSRGNVPKGAVDGKMETGYDTLYFYAKDHGNCTFRAPEIKRKKRKWQAMHLSKERSTEDLRCRVIFDKKRYPPKGRHWALNQDAIDELSEKGEIRIIDEKKYTDTEGNCVFGMPESLQSEFQRKSANWMDIPGYSSTMQKMVGRAFRTENSEKLLFRVIDSSTAEKDVCLDFFAGSGTTQAVAQKCGRKWLGVEMGEHFDEVILPRLKKVLADARPDNEGGDGKGGGGICLLFPGAVRGCAEEHALQGWGSFVF